MKIVVLCGGVSTEREVSLRSSTKVSKALKSRGHQVVMIDSFFGEDFLPQFSDDMDFQEKADELRQKTALINEELVAHSGLLGPHVAELCRQADIVFIGLHGGVGEDGQIQKYFEDEGIRYTGSDSKSSAIAMDKSATKEVLMAEIPMPKGVRFCKGDADAHDIKAPCVIKPCSGGSSVGVVIVHEDADYESAMTEVFTYEDTVLIEEYVKGRELTQAVLGGKALPPVEICPDPDTWYDYNNKYNGKTLEICPAQIPEDVLAEMSRMSVRAGELLGLSVYYRVDYLLDDEGRLFALEANSLPGMTDTSLVPQEAAAVGMDYPTLCETIISLSMEKYC